MGGRNQDTPRPAAPSPAPPPPPAPRAPRPALRVRVALAVVRGGGCGAGGAPRAPRRARSHNAHKPHSKHNGEPGGDRCACARSCRFVRAHTSTQNVDTVNGAIRGRTHDLCAAAHVVCRSPPITPGRPGRRNRPTTHKQPGGKRAPRRQQRGCGASARGICGSGARVLRGRESARVAALGPRPSGPLADRSSDMEPS